MLHSHLLRDTVQPSAGDQVLMLNSAADPFVSLAAQQVGTGMVLLAEDNIAILRQQFLTPTPNIQFVPFHTYILHQPAGTIDIAIMNLLYQPANAWMLYGLHVAAHALRPNGYLYVIGAKDRGILTVGKRMQDFFGNVETLAISKGHRVLRSHKRAQEAGAIALPPPPDLTVFAHNQLDEGTRLLFEALEIHSTDEALDIGCGAGFIGLHIARQVSKGTVTMVDASLAAVAAAQQAILQSGLANIETLPSDGVCAVLERRFDLVVTNPPFHQGGIQTGEIAGRFIRGAAQVLRSHGRFYLVANRFLKYEPVLQACFQQVEEVGGNSRYKVLLGRSRKVGICDTI